MAVIDFRFRSQSRGFEEQISRHPVRTAEAIDMPEFRVESGWIRKNSRGIAHTALCLGIFYGSYQIFQFAMQLQYNLLILVP